MRIGQKLFAANAGLLIFMGVLFGWIYFSLSSSSQEEMTKDLNHLAESLKQTLEISTENAISSYLLGIAEENRGVAEYYAGLVEQKKMREDEAKQRVREFLLSRKIGKSGYPFVWDISKAPQEVIMTVHPKIQGKNVASTDFVQKAIQMKHGYLTYEWKNPGEEKARKKSMAITYFPKWNWILCASSYTEEFKDLLNMNEIRRTLLSIQVGDTGYPFILDSKGKALIHPNREGEDFTSIADADGNFVFKKVIQEKNGDFLYDWKEKDGSVKKKFAYYRYIPDLDWILVVSSYTSEYLAEAEKMETSFILIFILLMLVSVPAFFFLRRSIIRPLNNLRTMLRDIAKGEGDLTQKIVVRSKDEIRDVAEHFNLFLDKLRDLIDRLKGSANTLAFSSGDMAAHSQQTAASVQEITASIRSVADNMQQEKSMIHNSTQSVNQIIDKIEKINQMTEEIQSHIQQSSSAIEEMTANIASSADLAQQADHSSESLESISLDGKKAIDTLSLSIEDVSKNSENITEMVQLIMDISEQTNLLAMNAAIEAAHAGEYGKGFAVVAEEIRKLADKSSRSAREIQEVVKQIADNISKNLKFSDQTKESFTILKKEIDRVRQANHEISASMDEQKSANQSILDSASHLKTLSERIVEELNTQVREGQSIEDKLSKLNRISEEVSTAMDEEKQALQEASDAAEHMNKISSHLKQISQQIQQDFEKFKTTK